MHLKYGNIVNCYGIEKVYFYVQGHNKKTVICGMINKQCNVFERLRFDLYCLDDCNIYDYVKNKKYIFIKDNKKVFKLQIPS